MGRSLGVVVVGWATGFLIAVAWGATRANNPRLASATSGWAIVGAVVTALLLLSITVTRRQDRVRAARSSEEQPAEGSETAPGTAETVPPEVSAAERRAAARIAELEARLAREEQELDLAVASLAATELTSSGQPGTGLLEPVDDGRAAELEPALRQEVVDAVAALVGEVDPEATAALAGHVEALLEKTPQS